jgi:hypothetical protein
MWAGVNMVTSSLVSLKVERLRARAHQRNWQLQRNCKIPRNVRDFKYATGFQIRKRTLRKLTSMFDYMLTPSEVSVFVRLNT